MTRRNDPAQVKGFADMFAAHPMAALIDDAKADVGAMTIGPHAFVYSTAAPQHGPNCYLCSPTTAYIDYALEEIRMIDQPRIAHILISALVRLVSPIVKATGLDRQVQLNNWMVSTNPAPDIDAQDACAIRDHCLSVFPDRAIMIRSLNEIDDDSALAALDAAGFLLLAARKVYVVPKGAAQTSRDLKRDAKLLADTSLDVVTGDQFSDADFARCEALYADLYLKKYSPLNPHYTARFLKEVQTRGLMTLVGLRDARDGIVAFTVLFESLGTLTQPLVGYDLTRPQSDGLYRMVMQIGRAHAIDHALNYNMSAGADQFKANRGAQAAIEFSAVYVAHLSKVNRAASAILEWGTRKIGIPLVKGMEK